MDKIDIQTFLPVLEQACSDFLSPYANVRDAANQKLLAFREQASISDCKIVLEKAPNVNVQLHGILAMKALVIRSVSFLPMDELEALRQYLFMFMCHFVESIDPKVRAQAINIYAIIVKRAWPIASGEWKSALFNDIIQLTNGDSVNKKALGLDLLIGVLNEFSSSTSSELGLSFEHHVRCAILFEKDHLLPIFTFSVQTFSSIVNACETITTQNPPNGFLEQSLTLLLAILSWRFFAETPSSGWLEATIDINDSPISISPGIAWKDVLVTNSQFLSQLFQTWHKMVATSSVRWEALNMLNNILLQLSGLSGTIFSNDSEKTQFLTVFITGLISIYPKAHNDFNIVYPISQLLRRLVLNFGATTIISVPNSSTFLESTANFTCACLAKETEDSEILNEIVKPWCSIVALIFQSNISTEVRDFIKVIAAKVYTSFVQHCFQTPATEDESIFQDVNDLEEFMASFAFIGRVAAAPALQLLESQFKSIFGRFQQYAQLRHNSNIPIEHVQEEMYWLVTFSSYLLADKGEGETPEVPPLILEIANQNPTIVISLISSLFSFIDWQNSLIRANPNDDALSPLIAETLMQFLTRWSKTYLNMGDSNILLQYYSFTPGRTEGLNILQFIFQTIATNILCWSSEHDVAKASCELLLSLSTNASTIDHIVVLEPWAHLNNSLMSQIVGLPTKAKRMLITGILQTILNKTNATVHDLDAILVPFEKTFEMTIMAPDFRKNAQHSTTVQKMKHLLECFHGTCRVTSKNSELNFTLFQRCMKNTNYYINLISLYSGIPDVVLDIFSLFKDLCETHLNDVSEEHVKRLVDVATQMVKAYGASSSYIKMMAQKSFQKEEEKELYRQLLVILQLITIFNEAIDFYSPSVGCFSFVIFGLSTVLSLLSNPLMEYPKLYKEYFGVLNMLARRNPDKLAEAPVPVFTKIMNSLRFGLAHADILVSRLSLEAMASLAAFDYEKKGLSRQKEANPTVLSQALSDLMEMLLFNKFSLELLEPASNALLALMFAEPYSFKSLVDAIVAQQVAQSERILGCFNALTKGVTGLNCSKEFTSNLQEFLATIRLIIKKK